MSTNQQWFTHIKWADDTVTTVQKSGGLWVLYRDNETRYFRTLSTLGAHAKANGGRIVRPKPAPKATAPKASTKSGVVRPGDRGYPVGLAGLLSPRR